MRQLQILVAAKHRIPVFSVNTVRRLHPFSGIDLGAKHRAVTGIRKQELPLDAGDYIRTYEAMNLKVTEVLERRDAKGIWKNPLDPLDAKGAHYTILCEVVTKEQLYKAAGWEMPKPKKDKK